MAGFAQGLEVAFMQKCSGGKASVRVDKFIRGGEESSKMRRPEGNT